MPFVILGKEMFLGHKMCNANTKAAKTINIHHLKFYNINVLFIKVLEAFMPTLLPALRPDKNLSMYEC